MTILDGLTWLGLDWDEQPIFEGARLARHQQVADQLLKEGKAGGCETDCRMSNFDIYNHPCHTPNPLNFTAPR